MYFFFSSSEPERMTGSEPSLLTAGISEERGADAGHLLDHDDRGQRVGAGAAVASGTWTACRSLATSASSASCGKRASSSTAAANGAIFASASERTDVAEHVVLLGRPVQVEISRSGQGLSRSKDC